MGVHVAIQHRTTYAYDRPVQLGPQVVRLRPAPHTRTPILAYALRIEPAAHHVSWQQDPFGNFLARVTVEQRTPRLELEVDLVADLVDVNPFDFVLEADAAQWPPAYEDGTRRDLQPHLAPTPHGTRFDRFLDELRAGPVADGRRTIDVLVDANRLLREVVAYDERLEPGVQTPDETLARRIGSCRDSSWLLVQALRHLGVAARFASGYLVQLATDEEPADGPPGPTEDVVDLHAWAEAYLPGAGWVGLDPTSGLFAGEGHIPLACTREPSSAAPISGPVEVAEATLAFATSVRRVDPTTYRTP